MELMVGRGLPSSGAFSKGYGDDYYMNPNYVMVSYDIVTVSYNIPEPVTEATEVPSGGADVSAFVDRSKLRAAVEKYMGNKDAWAESDCDGTPCGDYYGYAKRLTCSRACK
jgi:hypothetical protein